MTEDDRLADLEVRVAALEAALGTAAAQSPAAGAGAVGYGGEVSLHGEVTWRVDYSAGAAAALPAERIAAVLGALGHPARIEIVQELLRGPRTAAELLDLVDAGSKGQLYHHLGALAAANVIEKQARGNYGVAAQKVVPALIAMLTAADIGGLLR
ncbi:ArsR/SmtB family transcription factor [Tsukamurella strandjordii]|uniref:Winged helix-turn-helix domain-containing protein n=1 Tax=Tsukamurella strandjordii TaxID=147577 RepID=A0AA90NFM5_9ACTN|nr:winged helix-turn-helix domain-containing protein [Tsukamurella strandjordii]MDP0398278.1 winged helix-turn-helix domain-containing protein [Tsukamurella strandjordii]